MSGHSRRDSNMSTGSNSSTTTTNIQVVVRIRPPTTTEINSRWRDVVHPNSNMKSILVEQIQSQSKNSATSVSFTFDKVIAGENQSQAEVYSTAAPFINTFLEGRNVTILALGQTGGGKSYTMGTDYMEGEDREGIIQRAVAEIFIGLKEKETPGTSFTVKLSYVEIYNEDLLDLLGDGGGEKPIVQIREGKDGSILFTGLKEVNVSSLEEVMAELSTGSLSRQTGSTSMNSQSSRSHAIFTLTLTQRRFTGTGPPPSPSSNRNSKRPSGIFRPASPASSVRSSTPTMTGRPGSALRPGSGTFGRVSSPMPSENGSITSEVESWVTTTSKFHFVDLAGSERLKRTSAIGDRAKEGISINSGLLALGNCISALGDPARKGITHVPYRDSKLTRLLQDSLGGNSVCMMIACVSSTEANVSETISTLKYANRARNIKNESKKNELEEMDLEGMQKLINKLRIELGQYKDGNGVMMTAELNSIVEERSSNGSQSSKVQELEINYSNLTEKYAQLKEELVMAQSSPSMSREEFSIAVEPIVEDYEKSLSALESQLSLTKAALGISEEEMKELELRLEEEEEMNLENQTLVEGLKARLNKLNDRELTTEAYVRDLEGKLKDYGETDENHGGAITSLRREIGRYREAADSNREYLIELESRLEKSEETNLTLMRKMEVLERDVGRRELANTELEKRLAMSDSTTEQKALLVELDKREKQLLDLERMNDDLREKSEMAGEESVRLQKLSVLEMEEKEELQSRIRSLERSSVSLASARSREVSASSLGTFSALRPMEEVTPTTTDISTLQSRHTQTLIELDNLRSQHEAALRSIADLSAQVEENSDLVRSPTASSFPRNIITASPVIAPIPIEDSNLPLPPPLASPSRSPRQRRSMPISPQSRLSFLGQARVSASPISHGRSSSLSQSDSWLATTFSPSPSNSTNTNLLGMNLTRRESKDFSTGERSYESMKEEVMKLQEALKEREEEIINLEKRVLRIRGVASITSLRSVAVSEDSIESMGGYKTPEIHSANSNEEMEIVELSTKLRGNLELGRAEEVDEVRLEVLMRSMALKESNHREVVEGMEKDLLKLKRQHQDLSLLSKHQVINMSSEITRLRQESETGSVTGEGNILLIAMQESLDAKALEIEMLQKQGERDLENARIKISEEYEELTRLMTLESDQIRAELYKEQKRALENLIEERSEFLEEQRKEYLGALVEQSSLHDVALEEVSKKHLVELEERSEVIKAAHQRILGERELVLRGEREALVVEHDKNVASLREEHGIALESLSTLHEKLMAQMGEDHSTNVASIREDHFRTKEAADSSNLDSLAEQHEVILRNLSTQHSLQMSTVAEQHSNSINSLRQEHSNILSQLDNELASSKSMHEESLSHHTILGERHTTMQEQLVKVEAEKEEFIQKVANLSAEHDTIALRHTDIVQDLEVALANAQIGSNQSIIVELENAVESLESALVESQTEREELLDQLHVLRSGENQSQPNWEMMEKDLEKYRESVKRLDFELVKTREERDSLSTQLIRISGSGSTGLGISAPEFGLGSNTRPFSPDGSISTKMIPPTPPPAMPMPAPPGTLLSGTNGGIRTSSTSSMNWHSNESPATSVRSNSATIDPVLAKRFDEQESQIARLMKQLNHCESDLQANIDLVNTLESALNDSERNLRKARNQMNDIAKERDSVSLLNDDLRVQVRESLTEVETIRHSVVQVESRLQEERQGKERAKAELERRLDDVKRRKSKFSCL